MYALRPQWKPRSLSSSRFGLPAKELHRRAIARYANGEMDVARVERLLTESSAAVNDQVNLLGIAELKPGVLVPAHCTGWRAQHALAARFPDAYVPNSVGTSFHL